MCSWKKFDECCGSMCPRYKVSGFIGTGFAASVDACVSATAVVALTGAPADPVRRCASALTEALPSLIPARSWKSSECVPAARPGNVHVRTGPLEDEEGVGSGNGDALPPVGVNDDDDGLYAKSSGIVAVTTTSWRLPAPSSV